MDFPLIANQIWNSLTEFLSRLPPWIWFQSIATLLAAGIAVIGATIAAKAAYRNSARHWLEEVETQRQRARDAERERISGILHALREEILQLWLILAADLGAQIETLDLKRKPLPYWSYNQSYFSVFDRNAGAIGQIEDGQLRTCLVRTYMFAKRLVDQYQGYTRMDLRVPANANPATTGASADTTYALHAGALTLVESYQALKKNIELLRNLLDAELGLKKTPLPFIDFTEEQGKKREG
ncbi:MAG: hypothetical protein JO271_02210 [Verrucomicrobia bacterium]|nr:hypothetical protein [Verrucomicrobiota bacterium]